MDRKLIAILVAGAMVMGFTAWRFSDSRPPEIPKSDRRFMHCAKCGQEMPFEERRFQEDCVFCSQKGPLVATKESMRKMGPPSGLWARMVPPLLIEVTVLAAVVYWYASWRRKARLAVEESDLYTECSGCGKKLRYRATRVGQLGQCPKCKHQFIFGDADSNDEQLHWWQTQWWSRQWIKRFKNSA